MRTTYLELIQTPAILLFRMTFDQYRTLLNNSYQELARTEGDLLAEKAKRNADSTVIFTLEGCIRRLDKHINALHQHRFYPQYLQSVYCKPDKVSLS